MKAKGEGEGMRRGRKRGKRGICREEERVKIKSENT